jgi:hypothetical protein
MVALLAQVKRNTAKLSVGNRISEAVFGPGDKLSQASELSQERPSAFVRFGVCSKCSLLLGWARYFESDDA